MSYKLTEKDVMNIRDSEKTAIELAREYNISIFNIYNIKNRRTFRNILSPRELEERKNKLLEKLNKEYYYEFELS